MTITVPATIDLADPAVRAALEAAGCTLSPLAPPGPPPASPDGTRGETIVDADGAVWSFGDPWPGGRKTLRTPFQGSAEHAGGGGAVEYLYLGGNVYCRNDPDHGSQWYRWTEMGWEWLAGGEPQPAEPVPAWPHGPVSFTMDPDPAKPGEPVRFQALIGGVPGP